MAELTVTLIFFVMLALQAAVFVALVIVGSGWPTVARSGPSDTNGHAGSRRPSRN